MKVYINPEIEIKGFETVDIIKTSGASGDSSSYRMLKTVVNGNEGTDYGSQEISIFD